MRSGPARGGRRGEDARSESYLFLSTRPLHILVFLAPLIALYEAGSLLYLTDPESGVVETIRAHRLMAGFFDAFGVGGFFLPGVMIVVVLLLWHVLVRDRWRIDVPVIPLMLIESAAWTIPLLILGQIVVRAMGHGAGMEEMAAAATGAAGGAPFAGLSAPARLTIAIGAGLYEELLFRLVGIAAIHLIAVDVAGMRSSVGGWVAVGVSALAFALYHGPVGASGVDWASLSFFFLAGMFFGGIYLWRGFGIVVAVHALYDIAVLTLL